MSHPILAPMSAESFARFWETSVTGYASQNVKSGRWPDHDALARSQAEYEKLLPQGMTTPDNHLFDIRDPRSDETVGSLWVGATDRGGARIAFVYDIRILRTTAGKATPGAPSPHSNPS